MSVMIPTTMIHAMIVIMILKNEDDDAPEDEIGIDYEMLELPRNL